MAELNTVIITGSDETYFPLVIDLFDSIRSNKKAESFKLAVIDASITAAQKTFNRLIRLYGQALHAERAAIT